MPAMPPPLVPLHVQAVPAPKPAAERSLEERFGSQFFNMIGIVAIFIGAAFALKLAVDKGLIGPVARVLIGLAAGAGVVLWSETFRKKGLQVFSWSLKAIGSGVLYLSLWAAFQLFHLLPGWAALGAMVLVTAWNAFMAWSQDAELLAAYALLGGFLTPLLLSTGGNHEIFLFTYLAVIDLGLVLLLRYKPWTRLLLPSFAVTLVYYFGWFEVYYPGHWFARVALGTPLDPAFFPTVAFVALFAALFAAVSVRGFTAWDNESETGYRGVVMPVLLPLANAGFLALALTVLLEDSGLHGGVAWGMVILAAIYLGLMRVQRDAVSTALHLACAVVFLSIAIPLKASGHALTISWFVEGLLLLWVSTRLAAAEGEEPFGAAASVRVLRALSAIGYVLGLIFLAIRLVVDLSAQESFFNADLGTALVAVAALAGAVWLASRGGEAPLAAAALIGASLVATLLVLPEFFGLNANWAAAPFTNPGFLTALVGIAVLVASLGTVARLARRGGAFTSLRELALVLTVAANLVTLLSVIREIDGLFRAAGSAPEAELQRSLAVSGFLMVYGAALLTAGFLRRSAFTRWQALILILFTICKVFLYDLSALSQGYRIVSVFALGALLMGVSLAYQRDWLGLRAPKPAAADEESA